MNRAHWHTFQVLTKRPERAAELASRIDWTPNIWLGTSVESPDYAMRSTTLSAIPAAIRFLSVEPLLAAIPNLPLERIDWAIVGGESGPGARAMDKDWVRDLRDQCVRRGVPFFFIQWGGVQKSRTGRVLDGRTWDEMPVSKREAGNGKEEKRAAERLGQTRRKRAGGRRTANSRLRVLGRG